MRGVLQRFKTAAADTARREIDDADKGRIVVRIDNQTQVGQRMLDFLPVKKAQPAMHAVRHAGGK